MIARHTNSIALVLTRVVIPMEEAEEREAQAEAARADQVCAFLFRSELERVRSSSAIVFF